MHVKCPQAHVISHVFMFRVMAGCWFCVFGITSQAYILFTLRPRMFDRLRSKQKLNACKMPAGTRYFIRHPVWFNFLAFSAFPSVARRTKYYRSGDRRPPLLLSFKNELRREEVLNADVTILSHELIALSVRWYTSIT